MDGFDAVKVVEDLTPFTYEKNFCFLRRLGSGAFGIVNESKRISDGNIFAIKRTSLPENLTQQDKVLREVVLAQQLLEHPHVVKNHNFWVETSDEDYESDIWKKKSDDDGYSSTGDKDLNSVATDQSEYESNNSSDPEHRFQTGYSQNVTRALSTSSSDMVVFQQQSTRRAESDNHNASDSASKKKSHKSKRSYLFIQMELCSGLNLKEWLLKTDKRPQQLVSKFILQITSALKYIHGQCLMHRDLKPGNIFFSKEENVLKVGDFGLAKQFALTPNAEDGSQETHSPDVGTRMYQSLEQMMAVGKYNYKVDIYALGVIWVEMLIFFSTGYERCRVLGALLYRTFPENFAKEYPQEHDLLMEILSQEPNQRPNASDIFDRLLEMKPHLAADPSIQALLN